MNSCTSKHKTAASETRILGFFCRKMNVIYCKKMRLRYNIIWRLMPASCAIVPTTGTGVKVLVGGEKDGAENIRKI
jgi:hypothetical protein